MAYGSYLQRRDGRYYIQFRWRRGMAALAERQLYRAALGTTDYRQARLRLGECMGWVLRMNDAVDFVSLFQKNVVQLQGYLQDAWPISDERLHARRNYEEMLKNLSRRARAAGCDPTMFEPEFVDLLNGFVQQNVDAEAWSRKAEINRVYEQGRTDMRDLLQGAGPPSSFSQRRQSNQTAGNFDSASITQPAFEQVTTSAIQRLANSTGMTAPHPSQAELLSTVPNAAQPLIVVDPKRFSAALGEYLEEDKRAGNNADARALGELVVRFIVDALEDPSIATFDPAQAKSLDRMLPDIPNRLNVPKPFCETLAGRYAYAQQHGWEGLKRLTETRLAHYHNALSKFFGWLIVKGYYPFPKPVFNVTSEESLVPLVRDAFNEQEALAIISQPLFTGCMSPVRIWKPGPYFIQSHLYWAYILLFLTGLRPGELGQLEVDDIKQGEDGIDYLYIRAFDPAKGRVARKDVKRYKTPSAQRIVPLHPLIIELGLLDRIEGLKSINCPVLFPEWEPYAKPNGNLRWGQPITKSWQYLKKVVDITRADVTLYSTRHWFSDLIDNTDIKHATRMRVMGHNPGKDIPGRYGAKSRLTTRDLAQIVSTPSPTIDAMGKFLLAAKEKAARGELTELRPWLQRDNWSKYYQEKYPK